MFIQDIKNKKMTPMSTKALKVIIIVFFALVVLFGFCVLVNQCTDEENAFKHKEQRKFVVVEIFEKDAKVPENAPTALDKKLEYLYERIKFTDSSDGQYNSYTRKNLGKFGYFDDALKCAASTLSTLSNKEKYSIATSVTGKKVHFDRILDLCNEVPLDASKIKPAEEKAIYNMASTLRIKPEYVTTFLRNFDQKVNGLAFEDSKEDVLEDTTLLNACEDSTHETIEDFADSVVDNVSDGIVADASKENNENDDVVIVNGSP